MSETEKSETKVEEKKKEELVDTVMRVLKQNHNYKFLLGVMIGWILAMYI